MRLRGGVYPQDQSIRQYPFGVGGDGGLSADQALPWLIDVDVLEQSTDQSGWNYINTDSSALLNGYSWNAGGQNAYRTWDVVLGAGTWTIELLHQKGPGRGIYTVQLDGATVGTIDAYQPTSNSYNQLASITGISVAVSAKKVLKLLMATKNASANDWSAILQHVQLRRTA